MNNKMTAAKLKTQCLFLTFQCPLNCLPYMCFTDSCSTVGECITASQMCLLLPWHATSAVVQFYSGSRGEDLDLSLWSHPLVHVTRVFSTLLIPPPP